jgi:hypothetical protein
MFLKLKVPSDYLVDKSFPHPAGVFCTNLELPNCHTPCICIYMTAYKYDFSFNSVCSEAFWTVLRKPSGFFRSAAFEVAAYGSAYGLAYGGGFHCHGAAYGIGFYYLLRLLEQPTSGGLRGYASLQIDPHHTAYFGPLEIPHDCSPSEQSFGNLPEPK